MKNIIVASLLVITIGVLVWFVWFRGNSEFTVIIEPTPDVNRPADVPTTTPTSTPAVATPEPAAESPAASSAPNGVGTIGQSVNGVPISAYSFGKGEREILVIAGVHGGYSWNTTALAYELIDELTAGAANLPASVRVTVIPTVNPDGLRAVFGSAERPTRAAAPATQSETIPGRFNARSVDLNRNFDCEWQSQGVWQDRSVSGGAAPFSEPEATAIRDYVQGREIAGAIVFYSAAGGVYASTCRSGILPGTRSLLATYASASGYPAYETFDYYSITGDMVNWLAKESIPAISVLLTNHTDTERERNSRALAAVIQQFAR
jgi:hypothetical protein